MIITVDTFIVDYTTYTVTYTITYDTVLGRFKVDTTSSTGYLIPNGIKLNLTFTERGKLPDDFITSSCDGNTKLSFYADVFYPFAYLVEEQNSTDCGYAGPVTPPATNPTPPVCDTVITLSVINEQSLKGNDGSIEVSITSSLNDKFNLLLINKNTGEVLRSTVIDLVNNTFTFSKLKPLDYTVKVSAQNYDCITTQDATVEKYDYYEKYYFLFCEKRFDKREIRLSIKKLGYLSPAIELDNAGKVAAEINYPGESSKEKFTPVLGSECNIKLISDAVLAIEDIYTDEEKRFLLELRYNDTQDLIWTGFILPDQSIEPFTALPYEVSYKASDGIKVLDNIDFDLINGRMTFLEGIKYCLDKTDLSLGFKVLIDFKETNEGDNVLLNGLFVNNYSQNVVVSEGQWKYNGTTYTLPSDQTIALPTTTKKRLTYFVLIDYVGVLYYSGTDDFIPGIPNYPNGVILAEILQEGSKVTIKRTPNYANEPLNYHTFDISRFIDKDGKYTNCYDVLSYLCKQFTAQVKQSDGFWVIENTGYKARSYGNLKETAYDNGLNLLYQNKTVNLSLNADCDQSNKILSGSQISIGAGYQKSIVNQIIGYPQPNVLNGDFELWQDDGGRLVPSNWEIKKPYNYFNRGSKFKRVYDPTTGKVITEEDGTYYFNFQRLPKGKYPINSLLCTIKSFPVAVFTKEVITLSFQVIFGNFIDGIDFSRTNCFIGFRFRLGNYICSNFIVGQGEVDAKWFIDDGSNKYLFYYKNLNRLNDPSYEPIGDNTTSSFDLPPVPIQGFFTIELSNSNFIQESTYLTKESIVFNTQSDVGIDNIKIKKTSPITGATVIDKNVIEVKNTKTFTTIPNAFETYFTDVNNIYRSDSIQNTNKIATKTWKRGSLIEAEPINNLIAKEILQQYQTVYKIFEGDIIGYGLSIRSIINLPFLTGLKFLATNFKYDLAECKASVALVQIFGSESANSGIIGGNTGGSQGGNVNDDKFIIGFGNYVLSDGNNNLFVIDNLTKQITVNYTLAEQLTPFIDGNLFIDLNGKNIKQVFVSETGTITANTGDNLNIVAVSGHLSDFPSGSTLKLQVKNNSIVIFEQTTTTPDTPINYNFGLIGINDIIEIIVTTY